MRVKPLTRVESSNNHGRLESLLKTLLKISDQFVMSTRKGGSVKKAQKYQNKTAFRNDLHDSSKRTKQINSLEVTGVCARCKDVIDWRKKYKKYKPLAAPRKCIKCQQKSVKHAYHTICSNCAREAGVCEKCGQQKDIVAQVKPMPSEQAAQDSQMQEEIKMMSERQRRSFFRHISSGKDGESQGISSEVNHKTIKGEGDTRSAEDTLYLSDCSEDDLEDDSEDEEQGLS